jgi:hypothetical protein
LRTLLNSLSSTSIISTTAELFSIMHETFSPKAPISAFKGYPKRSPEEKGCSSVAVHSGPTTLRYNVNFYINKRVGVSVAGWGWGIYNIDILWV